MYFKVSDLSVTVDKYPILSAIDINFPQTQFTGIIGPNGSGKSTLLKSMYKVITDYDGDVLFHGKNLQDWSIKRFAQENAVVPQINDMTFNFNVIDIVLMGRNPYKKWWEANSKQDVDIAIHNLTLVGLRDYRDRSFNELSGGERQRVILARALTQNPQCLILDEPTNFLDIKYQIEFFRILRSLNITVISVIHDLNLAANYCDNLIVMKDGRKFCAGAPVDVLTPEIIKAVFDVNCQVDVDRQQISIKYQWT